MKVMRHTSNTLTFDLFVDDGKDFFSELPLVHELDGI